MSKGPGNFPPEDRDRNCRACDGWGWQNFTDSEHDLIAQLDSCHQEVFSRPYFEDRAIESGKPERRFCPKCCGRERRAEDKSRFAQWRLDLRALETLVSRVRQGESFSPIEPNGGGSLNDSLGQKFAAESGRTYTYNSVYMNLAKSPHPGRTHALKKRSPLSLSDELTQLASLRKSGALTEDEFKLAKQKLLGSTSPKRRMRQTTKPEINEEPPDLPEENDWRFSIGDRVSHPDFGTGRVISISGSGRKEEIEINFHRKGRKVLSLAFAPLKKI